MSKKDKKKGKSVNLFPKKKSKKSEPVFVKCEDAVPGVIHIRRTLTKNDVANGKVDRVAFCNRVTVSDTGIISLDSLLETGFPLHHYCDTCVDHANNVLLETIA